MTENSLVDGFNKVTLENQPSSEVFVVNSYGRYSKKGYAPYNPKKKNQDVLVMAEDPKTRSLLLSVMDGCVVYMLYQEFIFAFKACLAPWIYICHVVHNNLYIPFFMQLYIQIL